MKTYRVSFDVGGGDLAELTEKLAPVVSSWSVQEVEGHTKRRRRRKSSAAKDTEPAVAAPPGEEEVLF